MEAGALNKQWEKKRRGLRKKEHESRMSKLIQLYCMLLQANSVRIYVYLNDISRQLLLLPPLPGLKVCANVG